MNRLIETFLVAVMIAFFGQMTLARADTKIKDQSSAIQRAVLLTGLDRVSKRISSCQIKIHGDNTPFLAAQFENKTAWRIEFGEISFTGKITNSPLSDPYQFQRKFIVLIDAQTGRLLEVKTDYTGNVGTMKPEPDAMSAAQRLRSCAEVYTGLPAADPKTTFFDAVNAAELGCPMLAKEVNGLYVMDSHMASTPRAVWIIILRGIPPIPLPGPPGSNPTIDTGRSVIDAATGACLFGTN
jgi:hypothetical protein